MTSFRFSIIACAFIGVLHAMVIDKASYPVIKITTLQSYTSTWFEVVTEPTLFSSMVEEDPSCADAFIIAVSAPQEFMRAAITGGHATLQYLAQRNPEIVNCACPDNRSWTPLLYAAAAGKPKVVAQLIALGANLSTDLQLREKDLRLDYNPTELALRCGHKESARCLQVHDILWDAARKDSIGLIEELNTQFLYPNPVVNGKRLLDILPKNNSHAFLTGKLDEFNRKHKDAETSWGIWQESIL